MFNIFVDISPANLALAIITFLVLFLILRHFLFKPVNEFLDKRRNYIAGNISDSEKMKLEAEGLKKEYEGKLLEAKNEAATIVSEARAYGEDLKDKASRESKDLARLEYEKGIKDLENEKAKVLSSLNDEIVDLAMSAAEKVLREKLDKNANKDLVRKLKKDLEASHE